MFEEVARDERLDVQAGASALRDAVRPVGVHHQVERFAEFDETIHEPLGALIVDVVVTRPVDDEQPALQPLGEIDRRPDAVAFRR